MQERRVRRFPCETVCHRKADSHSLSARNVLESASRGYIEYRLSETANGLRWLLRHLGRPIDLRNQAEVETPEPNISTRIQPAGHRVGREHVCRQSTPLSSEQAVMTTVTMSANAAPRMAKSFVLEPFALTMSMEQASVITTATGTSHKRP